MNYYEILGIDKSASSDDIKAAFKKLAKIHHPDIGGDIEKFKQINEAYSVLIDPSSRRQYDLGGADNPYMGSQPGSTTNRHRYRQGRHHHSDPGFESVVREFFRNFEGFGVDPEFEEGVFWNDEQDMRNTRASKMPDVHIAITTSLQSTLTDRTIKVRVKIPNSTTDEKTEYQLKIPAGIRHGSTIRYPGFIKSTGPNIDIDGDLLLTVNHEPQDEFSISGNDLFITKEIDVLDAIFGTELDIRTLDNTIVKMPVKPGTQHGHKSMLAGGGLHPPPTTWNTPNQNSKRGNLYVQLTVNIPVGLTDTHYNRINRVRSNNESKPRR